MKILSRFLSSILFFTVVMTTRVEARVIAELVVDGLSAPLYATSPPGDNRLFVVEKGGTIRIVNPVSGIVRPIPFLTIPGLTTDSERGLLGLAFHPDYNFNGFFFVYLTNEAGDTEIRRYTVSSDENVADPASALLILDFVQPDSNHNGGWMEFGPDGFLYVASGDGGGTNDPGNNAQDLNSLLGKILRLDIDNTIAGENYAIPPGNPFAGGGGAPEILHYGLRNPWRNSFDRTTGDLYIADVGQGAREEINRVAAGAPGGRNFGWRIFEGSIPTPGISDPDPGGTETPVFEYPRSAGQSITGGYVFRGPNAGIYNGRYFFADYVSDRVWSLQIDGLGARDLIDHTDGLFSSSGSTSPIDAIASFAEDSVGNLYIISLGGSIHRLEARRSESVKDGPLVKIRRPRDDAKFNRNRIGVSGVVRQLGGNTVDRVIVRAQGRGKMKTIEDRAVWRTQIRLRRGINRISAVAIDSAGRRSPRDVHRVTRR